MGGSTGVCGSRQRARTGLWSDSGLDWSSVLPSAAAHQHPQVYPPLLLQEGEDVTFNERCWSEPEI